jgi:uncharacterized protein YwlG (UPF0340 family)
LRVESPRDISKLETDGEHLNTCLTLERVLIESRRVECMSWSSEYFERGAVSVNAFNRGVKLKFMGRSGK